MEAVARCVAISLLLLTHLDIGVAFVETVPPLMVTLLFNTVRNMNRSDEAIISPISLLFIKKNILEKT